MSPSLLCAEVIRGMVIELDTIIRNFVIGIEFVGIDVVVLDMGIVIRDFVSDVDGVFYTLSHNAIEFFPNHRI